MDTASEYKCDFVLFPELITTQLLSFMKTERPGLAARKLAEHDAALRRHVPGPGDQAQREHRRRARSSRWRTAALQRRPSCFRRDGTLERQAKLHITPAERKWWGVEPGDRVDVFDTDCGRVAILICYDVEFPELARIAAGKGADLIFVPFNTDERAGYLRVRTCAQARAIENQVYVVIAGCVGNLPFVDNADIHYAQSGIFTPSDIAFERDGVAAECTPNIETMVMSDLDLEILRRARYSGTVQNWKDRRTDLYRLTLHDPTATTPTRSDRRGRPRAPAGTARRPRSGRCRAPRGRPRRRCAPRRRRIPPSPARARTARGGPGRSPPRV